MERQCHFVPLFLKRKLKKKFCRCVYMDDRFDIATVVKLVILTFSFLKNCHFCLACLIKPHAIVVLHEKCFVTVFIVKDPNKIAF